MLIVVYDVNILLITVLYLLQYIYIYIYILRYYVSKEDNLHSSILHVYRNQT